MRPDCLPSASVSVRVNGRDLQEYNTEGSSEDDAMIATTYVEAVEDAEFEVCLHLERGFAYAWDYLAFKTQVDGVVIRNRIIPLNGQEMSFIIQGLVEPLAHGKSQLKKCRFAAHDTTDAKLDARLKSDHFSKLGEIEVTLTRCHEVGKVATVPKSSYKAVVKDSVPEKALKGRAITHHTAFGAAAETSSNWVDVTYPYGENPIATYKFLYRSRRDLQIEGIIERSPSPVPLEDRDPNDLTLEEARELARRAQLKRTENDNQLKIKQEGRPVKRRRSASVDVEAADDSGDEGDVTFVSHSDARKRARNAEVIDLTAD
ncbi:hypothetical protein Q7P37_007873 [Cladosporium fusiforme]